MPAQVYVFSVAFQGMEGKSMSMPIINYTIKSNIVLVEGAINQECTVINQHSVTCDTGVSVVKKLRRL